MSRRRGLANDISSDVVHYLVTSRGLSQKDIAAILSVDKSFISRVRSAEREFSPSQLRRIADHLDVPLGAMLIDVNRPANPLSPETQQIVELCEKLLRQADAAIAAHRARRAAAD